MNAPNAELRRELALYWIQPPEKKYRYTSLECLVQCKLCGQKWDRDKNAALNILVRAKSILHEQPLPLFWQTKEEQLQVLRNRGAMEVIEENSGGGSSEEEVEDNDSDA